MMSPLSLSLSLSLTLFYLLGCVAGNRLLFGVYCRLIKAFIVSVFSVSFLPLAPGI